MKLKINKMKNRIKMIRVQNKLIIKKINLMSNKIKLMFWKKKSKKNK